LLNDIGSLIVGYDDNRLSREYAKKVYCDNRSWVRLSNPDFKKFGGGARVKKITITDKWEAMAGNGHTTSDYGQEYFYTTQQKVNGVENTISSGVASWEPSIGNDENLCRQPLSYTNKKLFLAPRFSLYQEDPAGESLYPAPVVGYSKVTVRNLGRPNVSRTATGYSVYQFYTARDFPTISTSTALHTQSDRGFIVARILKLLSTTNLTMTQGFTVEVNDMHGKPKTEETYNQDGGLLASTEYRYKTDAPPGKAARLKNGVDMVKPDGTIVTGTLGVEMDVWQEMSQDETNTGGFGVSTGLDVGLWGIFPAIFPGVYPILQKEKTLLRTSVTTKFIKRFGILDKVIKTENGSSLTTENLLYDSETGDPLLVKMQNEFNEPIYKFNYPAHWVYDNMGQVYKTQDAFYSNVQLLNGEIVNFPNIGAFLKHGDQVFVTYDSNKRSLAQKTFHISNINNKYVLIDDTGAVLARSATVKMKVIRPVRRNMAAVSIGGFESLGYPVAGQNISVGTATKVLNATVNTFNDTWQIPCNIKTSTIFDRDVDITSFIQKLCSKPALWYATPDQNVTVCQVLDRDPCTGNFNAVPIEGQKFYSLTAKPLKGRVTLYEARVGGCIISIFDPANNAPFKPESIVCNQPPSGLELEAGGVPLAYEVNCSYQTGTPCSSIAGGAVNPFVVGVSGNWRPHRAYIFDDKNTRNYTAATINQQGYYTTFTPFWNYGAGLWTGAPGSVWVRANTMTKYDRTGNELENSDALYKYSAALFGFKNQKPLATSTNCRYQQIAYEGFEEKSVAPPNCISACQEDHAPYVLNGATISQDKAHTGKSSVEVNGGGYLEFSITQSAPEGPYLIAEPTNIWRLTANGCNGTFQPIDGQEYVVSAWVYMDQYVCNATGSQPGITISQNGTPGSPEVPSGPSIDGWRKIEFVTDFSTLNSNIEIKLHIPGGVGQAWFDDIRIHPFNGSMKSFAYDPHSLRLMAELDERNYATFYEYDDAGLLVRVKRETERGVMTIQEGRTFLAPN
jgi:hypothetical protein